MSLKNNTKIAIMNNDNSFTLGKLSPQHLPVFEKYICIHRLQTSC